GRGGVGAAPPGRRPPRRSRRAPATPRRASPLPQVGEEVEVEVLGAQARAHHAHAGGDERLGEGVAAMDGEGLAGLRQRGGGLAPQRGRPAPLPVATTPARSSPTERRPPSPPPARAPTSQRTPPRLATR